MKYHYLVRRVWSLLSVCVFVAGGLVFAQQAEHASATLSVTAMVQPSCVIRVGAVADPSAPIAVLRCERQDVARAIITTTTVPAGAIVSTDPATRLVTIQF
jgi:hypothetical protein